VRELQALVRRRDDLREMAAREKGRLDSPALTRAARKSIQRAVRFLGREETPQEGAPPWTGPAEWTVMREAAAGGCCTGR
jgi:hypothetical protein